MKRSFITIMLSIFVLSTFAQAPQAFKFQAIARDNIGSALINKNISIKISVIKNMISDDPVYSEKHIISSNEQGLINLEIGKGTVLYGNFSLINWGAAPHFVKFQLDPAGGDEYIDMGTTQLLSVPYSLYADKAGRALVSDTAKIAVKANNVKWLSTNNKLSYSDGFVGIGTSNPTTNLHVLNNNDNAIFKVESGSLQAGVQVRSSGTYMPFINFSSRDYTNKGASIHFDVNNNQLIFKTSAINDGTREIVWSESGLMGIGMKNPAFKVDVNGDINFSGKLLHSGNEVNLTQYWTKNNAGNLYLNSGKIGVGTSTPKASIEVSSGDVFLSDATKGIILKSPNGQCWRVTVNDAGELIRTLIDCPLAE